MSAWCCYRWKPSFCPLFCKTPSAFQKAYLCKTNPVYIEMFKYHFKPSRVTGIHIRFFFLVIIFQPFCILMEIILKKLFLWTKKDNHNMHLTIWYICRVSCKTHSDNFPPIFIDKTVENNSNPLYTRCVNSLLSSMTGEFSTVSLSKWRMHVHVHTNHS